jgi:hypothetical protein
MAELTAQVVVVTHVTFCIIAELTAQVVAVHMWPSFVLWLN